MTICEPDRWLGRLPCLPSHPRFEPDRQRANAWHPGRLRIAGKAVSLLMQAGYCLEIT